MLNSHSTFLSTSLTSLFMRSLAPLSNRISPQLCLRTCSLEVLPQASGRISRLENQVDTLVLTQSTSQESLQNSHVDVPSTPWYRFCRPAAPLHDRVSFSSHHRPAFLDNLIDTNQENVNIRLPSYQSSPTLHDDSWEEDILHTSVDFPLISSHRGHTPLVTPFSAVSNILHCPVLLGGRIPKWSALHRQSNGLTSEAVGLSRVSFVASIPSPEECVDETDTVERSETLITPPVACGQSCSFTSQAAPGLTRPTVLKRNSSSRSEDEESKDSEHTSPPTISVLHLSSTKRLARSRCSDDGGTKKSRFQPLVPSEHSAFIPVRSKRR